MAESYLIAIKFVADNSTTKQTEKKLNSVFDRVTKRFKNGLKKVSNGFKLGGAIAGLATALSALLSPLNELNDKINATLSRARDIKQNAAAYGASVEEMFALEGYARAQGISGDALNMALSRIQVMLGEAAAGNENALSDYKNETNMAKVFYNVMNNLAKMDNPTERAKMASDIFGMRALTQLNPLITGGFDEKQLNALLKQVNLKAAGKAVNVLSARENQQSVLAYQTDIQDIINKSRVITPDTLNAQAKNQRAKLQIENKQISSYATLATIDSQLSRLLAQITELTKYVSLILPWVEKVFDGLQMIVAFVKTFPEDIKYFLEDIKRQFFSMLPKWLGGKS